MKMAISPKTGGNGHASGVDAFVLKLAAILGMTADHVGIAFSQHLPDWAHVALYAPGGLTFPIMAFLLTIGYAHTRNIRSYALRLLLFALIAEIPYYLLLHRDLSLSLSPGSLNVLFTLLCGLLVLYLYDHMQNRALFWCVCVAVVALTAYCDWSFIGIPMILCYHAVRDPRARVLLPALMVWGFCLLQLFSVCAAGISIVRYALPTLAYGFIGTSLTLPLISRYNGGRGISLKYFFYAYYPAHLAVIVLLRGLL
jgi:hypothetical protein